MPRDEFLTPRETADKLQVHQTTLINWERDGKIQCIRTKGGHRRYSINSFLPLRNESERTNFCYCRVSTPSQKDDLERQVQYFRNQFPNYQIVRDIGSGINFKRKGFRALLDKAIKGTIGEIVVTHRDRLCRFGFELIEGIVKEHSNGRILVLNQKETSPEQELVDDLISIITVFSSRLYGFRSHQLKRKTNETSKDSKIESLSN